MKCSMKICESASQYSRLKRVSLWQVAVLFARSGTREAGLLHSRSFLQSATRKVLGPLPTYVTCSAKRSNCLLRVIRARKPAEAFENAPSCQLQGPVRSKYTGNTCWLIRLDAVELPTRICNVVVYFSFNILEATWRLIFTGSLPQSILRSGNLDFFLQPNQSCA